MSPLPVKISVKCFSPVFVAVGDESPQQLERSLRESLQGLVAGGHLIVKAMVDRGSQTDM